MRERDREREREREREKEKEKERKREITNYIDTLMSVSFLQIWCQKKKQQKNQRREKRAERVPQETKERRHTHTPLGCPRGRPSSAALGPPYGPALPHTHLHLLRSTWEIYRGGGGGGELRGERGVLFAGCGCDGRG